MARRAIARRNLPATAETFLWGEILVGIKIILSKPKNFLAYSPIFIWALCGGSQALPNILIFICNTLFSVNYTLIIADGKNLSTPSTKARIKRMIIQNKITRYRLTQTRNRLSVWVRLPPFLHQCLSKSLVD